MEGLQTPQKVKPRGTTPTEYHDKQVFTSACYAMLVHTQPRKRQRRTLCYAYVYAYAYDMFFFGMSYRRERHTLSRPN